MPFLTFGIIMAIELEYQNKNVMKKFIVPFAVVACVSAALITQGAHLRQGFESFVNMTRKLLRKPSIFDKQCV